MDSAALLWGLLFGSIGLGFVIYGRRQRKPIPFLCGMGLMGAPYLMSSTLWLVMAGTLLVAIPFFLHS
ncbi:hypothetical protein OU800_17365 [Pseudomonas sp. GOM7]|uniref:hypothetical protein n=1 Tax=unclassified Pseudomonas TaxID=196821 RepID=UPI00227D574B|nr:MULTISPECIES: hypothetical protein [unclassified Pseudomonas]WAJ36371.1 hypothetical protein OU800_17365 [Pseudomonas sp. GOM7]